MNIEQIPTLLAIGLILLLSVGLHEYAHAWSAYTLGDPTPALQGRLTLNPFKHISLLGFLSVFLIGFGWGKPVQINPTYFKRPFRDELLTSLAGPCMNFLLALVGGFFLFGYARLSGVEFEVITNPGSWDLVMSFWKSFCTINLSLGIFNLLPIYPLDGYRLIGLFSKDLYHRMKRHASVINLVFLIIILVPQNSIITQIISQTTNALFNILLFLGGLIFY